MIVKIIHGIYTELSPDGVILKFESFLEKPIGFASEELRGKSWFEIFSPSDVGTGSPKSFKHFLNEDNTWTYRSKPATISICL